MRFAFALAFMDVYPGSGFFSIPYLEPWGPRSTTLKLGENLVFIRNSGSEKDLSRMQNRNIAFELCSRPYLQEFNTLFLTIFRTYKIATPPQTKAPVKTTIRDWRLCLYNSFVHAFSPVCGIQCCGSGSTCFWASRIRIH